MRPEHWIYTIPLRLRWVIPLGTGGPGIGRRDAPTFTVVAAVLLFVALAVCYIPAQKAMKVDPMVALRYE
jgi:hypothetical protein